VSTTSNLGHRLYQFWHDTVIECSVEWVLTLKHETWDCLTVLLGKWFVAWSHAVSHLGCWLLHGSLRIIKLQPRFKVCNKQGNQVCVVHSTEHSGCSFIILREPCNNQQPKCDTAWLHATNHFPSKTVKQSHVSCLSVRTGYNNCF
jgi:hypothetical protein